MSSQFHHLRFHRNMQYMYSHYSTIPSIQNAKILFKMYFILSVVSKYSLAKLSRTKYIL